MNCLDRHVEDNADKPAFIWEKDEPGTHEVITYGLASNLSFYVHCTAEYPEIIMYCMYM